MDATSRAFFRRQQEEEPENQVCVDLGSAEPQWASVSHGCYLSLEASGVHRSLGVHISFVRSTTMDAWKPQQLRLMELGGNARLKAFFREHGIADDMPIAQKYNTRAAEWYRKNLRAEADGTEPPPPLEPDTGRLPASDAPSGAQAALARAAAAGSLASPGGASASSARHYAAASPPPSPGASPSGEGTPRRRQRPSSGSAAAPPGGFLTGILSAETGAKVSAGVWSTVGLVGDLANRAREGADAKLQRAQREGWLDAALDRARQGAETAAEAGRGAWENLAQGRGGEALADSARGSLSWVTGQLAALNPQDSSAGLQQMSTGRMQGFGPDSAPAPASPPAPSSVRRLAHLACCEEDGEPPEGVAAAVAPVAVRVAPTSRPEEAKAQVDAPPPPAKAAELWNDGDDWCTFR